MFKKLETHTERLIGHVSTVNVSLGGMMDHIDAMKAFVVAQEESSTGQAGH